MLYIVMLKRCIRKIRNDIWVVSCATRCAPLARHATRMQRIGHQITVGMQTYATKLERQKLWALKKRLAYLKNTQRVGGGKLSEKSVAKKVLNYLYKHYTPSSPEAPPPDA